MEPFPTKKLITELNEGAKGQNVVIYGADDTPVSKVNPQPNLMYGVVEGGGVVPVKVDSQGYVLTKAVGDTVGYSKDQKPKGNKGDTFLELDTKDVYVFDGTEWVLL